MSIKMFNEYIRQLHVSAPTGHLQVVFKRTLSPTTYNVRASDGEISTSGLSCVIVNFYVQCGGVFWLEARWGLVASIEFEVGVKRRVPLFPWGRVAGRPEMALEVQSLACGTEMCVRKQGAVPPRSFRASPQHDPKEEEEHASSHQLQTRY